MPSSVDTNGSASRRQQQKTRAVEDKKNKFKDLLVKESVQQSKAYYVDKSIQNQK